ncbi:MAG: glycosyltransferase family 2 protein [Chloroflexi bacterium]|nr:glycosyltransferase family 2 protein [Chloroflexota bacterium]
MGESEIKELDTQPYLSIVIPTWNEEKRLPQTLQKITSYLQSKGYPAEILVVDDGSTDNTVGVAEEFAQKYPSVRLIRNDHRGKAYTVRTGMLAAQGQYILFTDADGATPIEEVDKLLPFLEQGYDVAIGSREGAEAKRYNEPWYRHFMGRVFNWIVRLLALPGIQDTQCGFKAFQRTAARDLFGHMQLYGSQTGVVKGAMLTGFDVEILFMARKWGYRIAEVPVHWYYGAESKVHPLKDSWRNLRDVLRVRWNDIQGRYERH